MGADFYDNREQSQAKHEILKRYLVPFANKILFTWRSIDFIDGFAGPWKNRDVDSLTDTSIGVALRTLSMVAEQRGHTLTDRRIRCVFNEQDPQAYALLEDFIERSRSNFPLLKINTFKGSFEDNARAIRRVTNHSFQLLFVDPTGHTGFPPSSLEYFNGRSSEIIVNFMRSFIERFVSGNHKDREKNLVELVGEKRARYLLDTGLTIDTLEAEYLKMLRADLRYKYAGFSPIHNPDKNQIHFNLAYATNHPDGMEVMRSAEFDALSDHDQTRFKKIIRGRGGDLFEDMFDEIPVDGPYLTLRKSHERLASAALSAAIPEGDKGLEFCKLAANVQQELYLRRKELGDVLVEMADDGIIDRSWEQRKGRKPRKGDIIRKIS